ncbi:MAG: hypothetical protein H0W46_11225 [Acidimicrobiia bacterium]|nr:hypothetical protein [Acidimicrobiia bacterium]
MTDRPSIVEAPVRPLRDDHVAARLRSAVGRRTEHPCRSPWRSPLGRRRSPSSAATVPAAASGARLFLVAVADVDVAGFQMTLPADAASLDAVGEFCRTNPNAAVREFTVA